MKLFRRGKGLLADKKGNVLIVTAAVMPLLVGSAGLAIDTIQLSLLKRHLQRAADSGALAGAYARAQSKPVSAAVNQALAFNDAFPLASPATITEPNSGTYANRAVRVRLAATRSLPFWSFFRSAPTITVEAMAALVYTGKYCMVSLDESSATGIRFSGNSTVNLGCGVISNTSGSSAVVAEQSSTVTASPVAAVGNVPSSTSYVQPTLLLPYSLKQPDPFASLPQPTAPSGCQPLTVNTNQDITPTTNCFNGLDVRGTLRLNPGTYYVTGGSFNLNAQSNIIGSGVTIVFTSPTPSVQSSYPTININGGANINLTAPTSGTYAGVLMHYDARKEGGDYFINGNSGSTFEGAFYFPKQNLTFNGNSNMITNCIQLVAYRLTFTGNTKINNNCPTGGGARSFDASWVRLVA
ncbi:MAG TPA: pilus assembly protein TadG-related protein [Allosphingosinicella sp.]|nr:pilus assembly protein TadG-related protein [Allosphingosinicella sp.]